MVGVEGQRREKKDQEGWLADTIVWGVAELGAKRRGSRWRKR
jgi:hypothetical protein